MLGKEEVEKILKWLKTDGTVFLTDIEKIEKYIEQQEQENNKQNKIIDEMLDEYEYNARCNLNNFCDEEMRKDKCIQDCRICIKQYFEKKVDEE